MTGLFGGLQLPPTAFSEPEAVPPQAAAAISATLAHRAPSNVRPIVIIWRPPRVLFTGGVNIIQNLQIRKIGKRHASVNHVRIEQSSELCGFRVGLTTQRKRPWR